MHEILTREPALILAIETLHCVPSYPLGDDSQCQKLLLAPVKLNLNKRDNPLAFPTSFHHKNHIKIRIHFSFFWLYTERRSASEAATEFVLS